MQFSIAFLAVLFAAGYGFTVAGGLGALTGLVASLAITTGLLQVAGLDAGPAPTTTASRWSRRVLGVFLTLSGGWAAYRGGWHNGWLYALAAIAVTALGPLLVFKLIRKARGEQEV